jgi:hypothetical protein
MMKYSDTLPFHGVWPSDRNDLCSHVQVCASLILCIFFTNVMTEHRGAKATLLTTILKDMLLLCVPVSSVSVLILPREKCLEAQALFS